jgi:hypothetical protein
MLFNPCNPFLKRIVGLTGNLVTFKQFIHNLRLGLFLVCVDSLPYTFFLLNGDMELNKNRQIFVNKMF